MKLWWIYIRYYWNQRSKLNWTYPHSFLSKNLKFDTKFSTHRVWLHWVTPILFFPEKDSCYVTSCLNIIIIFWQNLSQYYTVIVIPLTYIKRLMAPTAQIDKHIIFVSYTFNTFSIGLNIYFFSVKKIHVKWTTFGFNPCKKKFLKNKSL